MSAIKDSAIYVNENLVGVDTYDLGQLDEVTIKNTNKKKLNILETIKKFYKDNKNYVIAGVVLLAVVLGYKYFKK